MKKIFLVSIVLISSKIFSQDIDSVMMSRLRLNFAIPDIPAFNAMEIEPSNILRPSTPQALAIAISQFYNKKDIVIPKTFALEVSPSLLLQSTKNVNNRRLTEYQKNKTLNSLRISLGSSSDTTLSADSRNLGIGLRISLINKGDWITDKNNIGKISSMLEDFRKKTRIEYLPEFAIQLGIDTTTKDWEEQIMSDKKLKAAFNSFISLKQDQSEESFNNEIKKMKENYKKDNWNADKMDIAMAVVSNSPDSLVKNIKFNSAKLWFTYALRAGKSGQFLMGLFGSLNKNYKDTSASAEKEFYEVSVPLRYLLGSNRAKAYTELQYKFSNTNKAQTNYLFLNFGTELNILDGFWLDIYGGLQNDVTNGKSSFVSNLKIKITMPENFKF